MMTKLLCLLCLIAAVVPVAWGQAANNPGRQGILGYLDPRTGQFRPVPSAAEETDIAAATTVGGTVNVTITITVKTTALTNFTCSINLSTVDNQASGISTVIFDESNTVAATGTGTTRTCKLSIPYSWSLVTPTADNMSTTYTVFSSTGTSGLPQRTSSRSPLDTRKVPANGTITTLTAAVTQ